VITVDTDWNDVRFAPEKSRRVNISKGAPGARAFRVVATGALMAAVLLAWMAQTAAASAASYSLSPFAGTGVAGPPSTGSATSSQLNEPDAVAVDSSGDVYIADDNNNEVEKVTPSGVLSIIAGNGTCGQPTVGQATNSELCEPAGVAVDSAGNVYIANYGDSDVVKVTPSGTLSIIAGDGTDGAPTAGQATNSELGEVWGVAVDWSGDIYIADDTEQLIEKVTPSGTLSIFAGIDGTNGSPTPGPATDSDLDYPTGIATDSAGNVYLDNYDSSQILKFTPSGTLSIFAGNGSFAASTPGPATLSALEAPFGVATDAAGDVYIADTYNYEIDEVTPDGTLSVIAGDGTQGPPTYSGPATSSELNQPDDVASSAVGRLYIADTANNTIDLLAPPAPVDSAASAIAGPTAVGQTLTASEGTWTNAPVMYSYEWEDCDSVGATCTIISGATSASYTLAAADAGHTIRVIVTASNGGGSSSSTSNATAVITGSPTPTPTLTLPSNAFTISSARATSSGTVVLTLTIPGAGVVDILGTHEDIKHAAAASALLNPGGSRFDWGRASSTAGRADTMTVALHPDNAGKHLLKRHRAHGWALHVTIWTTYIPAGGNPRSTKRTVRVLSAGSRP
jgi:hypothetical protein